MKRRGLLPLLLALILLCGCTARRAETGKLRIVTTLFPYYDFARAIAGDRAEVTLLLAPGREAHSFEPTPADAVTLAEADVFLYNGGESEEWAEELLGSVGERVPFALCMMDTADLREEEIVEGMQVRGSDEEEEETEYDEHIWTSPVNAIACAQAIRDVLCEADAAHADDYRANCAQYCGELTALDGEFRSLRQEAKRDVLLFADRFPMLYFCREYDLRYFAAFHGCSSDTEPSLATLRFLIDRVREEKIPAVYTVDLDSQKIAEAVAECTGAKILRLCSGQTVSRADFEAGETYLSLMRRNLDALREGLT